ncbi:MAG: hypothetical protein RI894_2651 [Bacteroidota bacterium]|jgi:uncharacterized metal-binding protein YceD (DUF177 family)
MIHPHLSYSIPFTGLTEGIHEYKFHVDSEFFSAIKDPLVSDGDVDAVLLFDKRPNMMLLSFTYEGVLTVTCDRCADDFDQEIVGESEYIVKFGDRNYEEEDIVYILRSEINLNVAHYLYESMVLELPLRRVHPDDNCNPDVVKNIAGESDFLPNFDNDDDEQTDEQTGKPINENNPFAKAFGDIKSDKDFPINN